MLNPSTDALASTSPATVTSGADAQLIPANPERNGLRVCLDSAAAGPVYLKLRSGAASATSFDVVLAAGQSWNGRIGAVVWRGAVRVFGTGGLVGVAEA